MSQHFDRGRLLYLQKRYREAVRELEFELAIDPECAATLGLLARCLSRLGDHDEAERTARRTIAADPEDSIGHVTLSEILNNRGLPVAAISAIREALRIDPEHSQAHAWEAALHNHLKSFRIALGCCERGLALDPEDPWLLELRGEALAGLGRHADARQSLHASLRNDPEGPGARTSLAWSRLEAGDVDEALDAFGAALRLDPDNDWAREGWISALKARHRFYRWLLRLNLFAGRSTLTERVGGGIVALAIAIQASLKLLRNESTPWMIALIAVSAAVIYLMWVADPLFNFLLLFDPRASHALTPWQRRSGMLFGIGLGIAGVSTLGLWMLLHL